jgi:four helix bundle protein
MLEFGGRKLEVGGEKVRGEGQTKTAERHVFPWYVFPFEKLEVWQESVELADYILGLLEHVPQGRHLRLVSQMEGAATSIAQNIAEGKGRQHRKEFLQYLSIAQGSLYETVTLNEVFRIRKLFNEGACVEIRRRAEHIDRKLNGLMNSVRGKKREEWGRGGVKVEDRG